MLAYVLAYARRCMRVRVLVLVLVLVLVCMCVGWDQLTACVRCVRVSASAHASCARVRACVHACPYVTAAMK